ncbi:MAG: zinc ABC transporter substrate-binding protein, partial [Roseibium sp.]
MNSARKLLLASTLLAASAVSASAEITVVASIKPVHSLVAAVMQGAGDPGLIVEGAGSPHNYALKPSQAQMLESADIIFWVGHELEAFLEKPLETVGAQAKSVELIDAPDLLKLGFREGGAFEKHDHGDEAGHDDHAHDNENTVEADQDHAQNAEAEGHEDHAHGEFDFHVWLDPVNAKAMVHEIEEALAAADPANAGKYEANAEAVTAKLDALIAEVQTELDPVKQKGFIVFHDAYHYFENRFGVTASGSITVSPEVMPGAQRITEIRARVKG